MASIKEVAARAGVSVATVSRVLNDSTPVTLETRDRVLAAVRAMDYSIDQRARALRRQKSGTLGLIVAEIRNPFFTEAIHSIEAIAYESNHSLFLCNSDEDPERERFHLRAMQAQRIDGIIGYVCARILQAAQGMPGARILRTCFIIPTMMTSLAVALFWGYILDPLIGVANWLLSLVHVAPQPWFTAPGSAFFTLTGVYLWQWAPFTSILLLAGLLNIPQPIYEAAAVDGVRWYNRIISIDIPLLRRVGAIAAILAVVEVIRLFDLVYGSTQGGPGTATLTNAVEIYRIGFEDFDTGYAAATSLIILVVTILIAQVFVRVLREEPGR